MTTETQLRALLDAEVAGLEPDPTGWDVISRRVARRRRTVVLRRGLPTAAAIGVLVLLATLAGPMLRDPDRDRRPDGPVATSGPDPAAAQPLRSIWPYTVRAQAQAWERDEAGRAGRRELSSQAGAVRAFVKEYVGLDGDVVAQRLAVGADGTDSFDVALHGIHLAVVGVRDAGTDAEPGPYVITTAVAVEGEGAPALSVEHDVDVEVRPPRHAFSGLALDADEAVAAGASVRASLHDGDGDEISTTAAELGGQRWEATLDVPYPGRTGSVLVTARDAEGTVHAFAARPVLFAVPVTSTPTAATTAPEEFVAVRGGIVGAYRTADGSLLRELSAEQPGGGATDPSIDTAGNTVVYAQGAGTCAAGIHRVPLGGGPSTQLVPADRGAASAPALSDRFLAYALTQCAEGVAKVDLVLRSLDTGAETVLDTTSGGSVGFRSLTWTPDGERLAAVVDEGIGSGRPAEVRVYQPGRAGHDRVAPPETCSATAVTWQLGGGRRLLTAQYCGAEGAREARLYVAFTAEDGAGVVLGAAPLLVRGTVPIVTLTSHRGGTQVLWSESIRSRGIEVWTTDFDAQPVRVPTPPDLQLPAW